MLRNVQSNVFLRQDIESILQAIDAANSSLAALTPTEAVAAYRAGFADALQAVALALHIVLPKGGEAGQWLTW